MNRMLSGPIRTTSPARGNTPPEHSSSGTSVSSVIHDTWQTIKGRAKSPKCPTNGFASKVLYPGQM